MRGIWEYVQEYGLKSPTLLTQSLILTLFSVAHFDIQAYNFFDAAYASGLELSIIACPN